MSASVIKCNGILPVSVELLAQVLRVPQGCKIVDVRMATWPPHTLELLVDRPGITLAELELPPRITLIYEVAQCETCRQTRISNVTVREEARQ